MTRSLLLLHASDLAWTSVRPLHCDTSETLTLSGKLVRSFEPEFDLRWRGGVSLRNPIRSAKAILAGSLTAKLKAELTGADRCLIEQELARPSWHTVILVHGVPVPVTFAIPLTASVSAQVSSALSAAAKATVEGQAGVEYDGHVHGIHDFPKPALKIVPTYAANAKLEVTAGPDLALEAGWRVPPSASWRRPPRSGSEAASASSPTP